MHSSFADTGALKDNYFHLQSVFHIWSFTISISMEIRKYICYKPWMQDPAPLQRTSSLSTTPICAGAVPRSLSKAKAESRTTLQPVPPGSALNKPLSLLMTGHFSKVYSPNCLKSRCFSWIEVNDHQLSKTVHVLLSRKNRKPVLIECSLDRHYPIRHQVRRQNNSSEKIKASLLYIMQLPCSPRYAKSEELEEHRLLTSDD